MFSNNNKISKLQMKRLLMMDILATTIMIIPYGLANISGVSGIFSLIIGGLVSLLFSYYVLRISHLYSDNYLSFMERCVGKIGSYGLILCYMVKFFISLIYVLRLFTEAVSVTFLAEMSPNTVAIAVLLLGGYSTIRGIEVRSRLGELFFYVVLIPIIIIILLALPEVKLENLTPILTHSPSAMVEGGYYTFVAFSAVEFILFVGPFVKGKKHIYKTVSNAIITITVFLILLYVAVIGIFTVNGVKEGYWSTVTLMQVVRFPGGFLSRQDGLMLGFWMISIFVLVGGYLFYLGELTRHIRKPKREWLVTVVLMVISFIGFYIMSDYYVLYEYYMKIMSTFGVATSILIPALLVVIYKIKNRGRSRQHERIS